MRAAEDLRLAGPLLFAASAPYRRAFGDQSVATATMREAGDPTMAGAGEGLDLSTSAGRLAMLGKQQYQGAVLVAIANDVAIEAANKLAANALAASKGDASK